MSASKKRSAKENVTGNAANAAKKAKMSNADAHWNQQVTPFLAMASKEQVEGLAKDLFTEVWKKNGAQAATNVVAPFQKKLQKDKNTNLKVAGKWNLDNDNGTLTIDKDISSGSFVSANVDVDYLVLESNETAKTLVYRGDADRWDYCQDDFEVELKMKYDTATDTIKGSVKVSPPREPDYGPSAAYGGSFNFTATREN